MEICADCTVQCIRCDNFPGGVVKKFNGFANFWHYSFDLWMNFSVIIIFFLENIETLIFEMKNEEMREEDGKIVKVKKNFAPAPIGMRSQWSVINSRFFALGEMKNFGWHQFTILLSVESKFFLDLFTYSIFYFQCIFLKFY